MNTFADRLNAALAYRQTNATALANRTGISQPTIWRFCNGLMLNPKSAHLITLANALNISLDWLQSGRGDMLTQHLRSDTLGPGVYGTVEPVRSFGRYPVLRWIDINAGNPHEENNPHGAANVWESALVEAAGPRAFWLYVVGDSMTAVHGKSFPEHTLILVDPDVEAVAGRFVVARAPGTGRPVFKRLTTDGANWFLASLNEQYPLMPIESPEVIGVCVEYKPPGGQM